MQDLIQTYKLAQDVETINTTDEITHLLHEKDYKAFITYPDALYSVAVKQNYTLQFICKNIHHIRLPNIPKHSGMYMKKGSVFTETLNHKYCQKTMNNI